MENELGNLEIAADEPQTGEPAEPLPIESIAPVDEPKVEWPLVSCIMPTAGRAAYIEQSIDMFMQQDYPNKELIIVFNKLSDIPYIYYPPEVKLVMVPTQIIGAKRNEAVRHAAGAIIAQWDDDDLYNTHRLSDQALPILQGIAEITGLQNFVCYEAPTGNSYKADEMLFAAIYGGVHGGTLVYNRYVWEKLCYYPNYKCGEDAGFLRNAQKLGARLVPVDGADSFVYVRHQSNTWKFEPNNFRNYPGWLTAALPHWAEPYAMLSRSVALSNKDNYVARSKAMAR